MWSDPARSCVGQGSAAGAGAGVGEASWRGHSWEERELQAEGLPVQRPRGRRALGASKGWRGARGLTGWSGWVPGPTWRTGCLVYSCGRRWSHSLHHHQEVLSDSVSSLSLSPTRGVGIPPKRVPRVFIQQTLRELLCIRLPSGTATQQRTGSRGWHPRRGPPGPKAARGEHDACAG